MRKRDIRARKKRTEKKTEGWTGREYDQITKG